jgi:hypothetical protein
MANPTIAPNKMAAMCRLKRAHVLRLFDFIRRTSRKFATAAHVAHVRQSTGASTTFIICPRELATYPRPVEMLQSHLTGCLMYINPKMQMDL